MPGPLGRDFGYVTPNQSGPTLQEGGSVKARAPKWTRESPLPHQRFRAVLLGDGGMWMCVD